MGKKILSAVLIVASFFWGTPAIAKKATIAGRQVKVILKDSSIINGELLGQDAGVLSILNEKGKLQDIAAFKIKKVFDADGKIVVLSDQTEAVKEEAPQAEEEQPAPAAKAKRVTRRSNGMKTAGDIMGWSGLVVLLVGALIAGTGSSQMSDALTGYYDSPYTYYGDYYGYEINGKYYNYTQYSDYYAGEAVQYTGVGIAVVGLAVGVTGMILSASASRREQASLMHLEDGQLAWSLPEVQLTPNMGGRMTLLSANF